MFPIRKWNNQSHKALPLVGRPIHVPQRLVEGRCTSVEVAKSVKKFHTVVNIIPTSIVNEKKALKVKSRRKGKEKFPSRHTGLPEILIITRTP
uniref:Uncharacterized protein n=1 Tax=Vespula pensylvanica TaxID=30213 RepID=A0A834UF44_VESPE|nr:hypothetical protein H0235_003241 [Vespula pensylvanica]